MKKKLLALSLVMICVSLASLGTVAYFNAQEQAHNVITTAGVDIELQEWKELPSEENPDGVPFEDVSGVMPGEKVDKIVQVENLAAESYIRVWVNAAISEPGDPITNPTIKCLPLTITVDGDEVAVIDIDYGSDKCGWTEEEYWTQGEDGYWYYSVPVEAGQATKPLFTAVTFHALMGNAYQNCVTRVDVSAEATQAANQNVDQPWDAKGWPET